MSVWTEFVGSVEIHETEKISLPENIAEGFNLSLTGELKVKVTSSRKRDGFILYEFEGEACYYVDEFCNMANRWMRYYLPEYCKKPNITITNEVPLVGSGFDKRGI